MLYPPTETKSSPPEPDMKQIFYEMKKKNVTLMLLWEEYKEKHPDGIMYTQFCERYKKFKKENQLTMHKEHKAGEEVETDWAGDTMSYVNPKTGEKVTVYIFVAVLPASSYPFAYAYENTQTPNWIDGHVRAYSYFGGVPKITIPDNTKTAVIKPDRVTSKHEAITRWPTYGKYSCKSCPIRKTAGQNCGPIYQKNHCSIKEPAVLQSA